MKNKGSNTITEQLSWKRRILDSKSASFCGAKWFNSSIWLWNGWTTSCHHNPPHQIDLEAIKTNPKALHNTPIKKRERQMMQKGEKPVNCQFCWAFEEVNPTGLGDRGWLSGNTSDEMLQKAFDQSHEEDYDLDYLELGLDRTCNLACSYCCPSISTSWAKDIKKNGPYVGLDTDKRQHYTHDGSDSVLFGNNTENAITEAFFKWWESDLHRTLKNLRITGGEPAMSAGFWKLMEWFEANPTKSTTDIGITTNLIYDDEKLDKILYYASKMTNNKMTIATSAESLGKKCEYIRDGFEWDQWESNVEKCCSSPHIYHIKFNTTISAIAADGLLDFLNWYIALKKKHGINKISLSINPLRFPTFQNIVVLPTELRMRYSTELLNFLDDPMKMKMLDGMEEDHIRRFAHYLIEIKSPHQEERKEHTDKIYQEDNNILAVAALQVDFKKFFTQYDQRRGKNLIEVFPNLAEWYKGI